MTIHARLAILVIACMLPVSLAAGLLIYRDYEVRRAQTTGDMLQTARAVSLTVERELLAIQGMVQVFALSPSFTTKDFAGIHHQAEELLRAYPGADIIVADITGQQVVNSYLPFGAPLPKRNNPEVVKGIFETARPIISDLFLGAVTKRPLIGIDVPVVQDGHPLYDLTMTLPTERLASILSLQHFPEEWVGTILDTRSVVVARSRNADKFIGKVIPPAFREMTAQAREGVIAATNLDGVPVYAAFSRSEVLGWGVVIAIPTASITNELRQHMWWSVGCVGALSLAGLALAFAVGRRIADSILLLVPSAVALGRGETVTGVGPHLVKETEEVGVALVHASTLLGERAAERDTAERALHELNIALEQRVAERTAELAQTKDAAEAANRAKSQFLANTSHELRTPLNAVLGFAQLLGQGSRLSAEQRRFLDAINRSGKHLLAVINDILEISRIESGRLQLHCESFAPMEMLQALMSMMLPEASNKGLELNLVIASPLPDWVTSDPVKLREIILNLLSNAVKFTERGAVELVAEAVADGERIRLRFEVSDTGIGIAADQVGHIFEPFSVAQQGGRRRGSGLGLSISRRYVEALGGQIAAESKPGKGTIFRFEIPVEPATAPGPAAAPQTKAVAARGDRNARVLVVDDDPDQRYLSKRLLEGAGFAIREAAGGCEALRIFSEWQPQLILMDMRMPGMDGIEATQAIRGLPHGDEAIVIALTASAFEEERVKFIAAGCNDVAIKPVELPHLLALLEQYLSIASAD